MKAKSHPNPTARRPIAFVIEGGTYEIDGPSIIDRSTRRAHALKRAGYEPIEYLDSSLVRNSIPLDQVGHIRMEQTDAEKEALITPPPRVIVCGVIDEHTLALASLCAGKPIGIVFMPSLNPDKLSEKDIKERTHNHAIVYVPPMCDDRNKVLPEAIKRALENADNVVAGKPVHLTHAERQAASRERAKSRNL